MENETERDSRDARPHGPADHLYVLRSEFAGCGDRGELFAHLTDWHGWTTAATAQLYDAAMAGVHRADHLWNADPRFTA
jgi:hypothetical protein